MISLKSVIEAPAAAAGLLVKVSHVKMKNLFPVLRHQVPHSVVVFAGLLRTRVMSLISVIGHLGCKKDGNDRKVVTKSHLQKESGKLY